MTPAVHRAQAAPVEALPDEDVEDPLAAGLDEELLSEDELLEEPDGLAAAGSLAVLLLRLSVR